MLPADSSSRAVSIRVVIPAFRAASTIRDVVGAVLQSEGCHGLSVTVVDDGGNGNLAELLQGLAVEIIRTGCCGSAAAARNRGALGFEGEFLVFVDSDVIVDRLCIAKLLEPLRDKRAEATVGNYSKDVSGTSFASRYKQLYISRIYERRPGYLHNDYWTAAAAIDAHVFQRIRGFDTEFRGACGEDGDLGGRLTLSGYRILSVPEAIGRHYKPLSLPQLFRNDWTKGLIAIHNYRRFNGSISDNRHATRRDILAVLVAAAILVSPVAFRIGDSRATSGAAEAVLVFSYLAARADLLRVFTSQGAWFLARACGVMLMLDLIRIACVAIGLGLPGAHRVLSRR